MSADLFGSRITGRWAVALLLLATLFGSGAAGVGPAALVGASGVAGLARDGTPVGGRPVVVTAPDRRPPPPPSGKQVLRLAGPRNDPASLDPALARDLGTAFLCRQVFRGLTRLNNRLEPVPELADRIEIAADGLVYTFRLRADAVFQDGRSITAADVVASLTRALSPATAGGEASGLGGPSFLADIVGAETLLAGRADDLAGARAIDDRTVELRITEPRATFLMKLAGVPASIVDPNDPARGGEWWRSPNGSGPFRVESWEPDARLVLTPHDGYPVPPVTRVDVRLGPATGQPFNLYQADEIDVLNVPSGSLDRVLDPGGPWVEELDITPRLAVAYLAFRTDRPPMDDPHVRRAVALAFPRAKIASVTYGGHRLPADGVIPPGTLGRPWPVDAPPHDVAAARREIAASRYGSAEAVPPIRIYGAAAPGAAALRDVLAAELGLRVEVVSVEWPEFNDGLHRREYAAYELSWGADYPDPESFLWSLFAGGAPDNYLDYQNDAVDGPLRDAANVSDVERRAELYERAHQALIDDAAVIPLYHEVSHTLVKPAVRGLTVTPMGILGLDGVWLER